MALDRGTPVLSRKRKRNVDFISTRGLSRTKSTSSSTSNHQSHGHNLHHHHHHQTRHGDGGSEGDWTRDKHGEQDATSIEANGLVKAAVGVARGLFSRTMAKITGHDERLVVSTEKENVDVTDQGSVVDELKKRKVLSSDFITPVKGSRSSLRQNLEDMPQIDESKIDVKFAKSPIEWNMDAMTQSVESNDYGTSFIKSKSHHKKNLNAPNSNNSNNSTVSEHLRSVYKGQFQPSPRQASSGSSTRPSSPLRAPSDNEKIHKRISSLSNFIQKIFKEKSAKYQDDDVIFLKEVRLPPPPPRTSSSLSFKFDVENLTFKNDFSTYQRLLRERKEQGERLHKEHLEATRPKTKSRLAQLCESLTEDDEAEIINIWKSDKSRERDVIVQRCDVDVRVHDLKSLADARWLNDTVIDVFLKLISGERVHAFSTFFFTNIETKGYKSVQKWMKRAKRDISKLDLILCPINVHSTHWVTGAIDLKNKKILYLDSLAGHETSHGSMALNLLNDYLVQECKKQGNESLSDGFTSEQIVNCPQQMNGYDCGVFTLMNCLCLSEGETLNYQPSQATAFRRFVAHRILHG